MSQSTPKTAIGDLHRWCESVDVNYDTIMTFIRERDGIIEQMLLGGLDAFIGVEAGLARCRQDAFMDVVTRIKYCIYDGYRMNMIVRDGTEYRILNGNLRVTTPPLFRDDERRRAQDTKYEFTSKIAPQRMLYRELSVKYNQTSGVYDVVADRTCSLDGFVNYDDWFAN